jgi:hypothetical protein
MASREGMTICTDIELQKWSPDFSSSGQANPLWTRLKFRGTELCNSIEWAEWQSNPVQVQLCDACGTIGCASGGYIHVSTFGSLVLWTGPQLPAIDDWTTAQNGAAAALRILGSIAFTVETWDAVRATVPCLPGKPALPTANRRAVADAWTLGPGRPINPVELPKLLRARLVAGDTMPSVDAIRWVEHWLSWLLERPDLPAEGILVAPGDFGAVLETLYFDGPRAEDWLALARRGDDYLPVLDNGYVFVPQIAGL